MDEYEKQANDFLKSTQTEFKVEFLKHGKHFQDDAEERDIYLFTFTRGNRVFKGKFGQSLANSGLKVAGRNINIPIEIRKRNNRQEIRRYIHNNVFPCSSLDVAKGFIEPTAYDVISCLTKYDPGTFKDFCSGFGYEEDSIKAHKTYEAVLKEWSDVQRIWTDEEIERMQEIN